MLGALTSEQQEMFSKNPRFLGLKFPDVSKPETLDKRYVGKMSKKALSLMNGLLNMNPADRLYGIKALMHPYFDDLRFKDNEFYKITEGENLDNLKPTDATRPIQSSQGPTEEVYKHTFEDKSKNFNFRAGVTAYSGFDSSSMKDIPMKRKPKKDSMKSKKMEAIYGRSLYDTKNASVTQFSDKSHTFGKPKYSNGSIKTKEVINVYGNSDMANTQYTSRNDEVNSQNSGSLLFNLSNTFQNTKKSVVYKGINNSKSIMLNGGINSKFDNLGS